MLYACIKKALYNYSSFPFISQFKVLLTVTTSAKVVNFTNVSVLSTMLHGNHSETDMLHTMLQQ